MITPAEFRSRCQRASLVEMDATDIEAAFDTAIVEAAGHGGPAYHSKVSIPRRFDWPSGALADVITSYRRCGWRVLLVSNSTTGDYITLEAA